MPSTHFTHIKEAIKMQLAYAQKNVYVAVAWFTDKELFAILCELVQKHQIRVYLLVTEDSINDALDFEKLQKLGGYFYRIDASERGSYARMHHKFCVIDERTSIIGSYNWTNNAQRNHESIVIIEDEPSVALDFIEQFRALISELPNHLLLNRANVLLEYLKKEDNNLIEKAFLKLQESCQEQEIIQKIHQFIQDKSYHQAIEKVQEFIKEWTQLVVYQDPSIAILKAEIHSIEVLIALLMEKKGNLSQKIYQFNLRYYHELGSLIEEILQLKLGLEKNTVSYQEAEKEYTRFHEALEEANQVNVPSLTVDEKKELKKLYNQAVKFCHPDKYSTEEEKSLVHEWFVQLNEANQQNNINRVRELLEDMQQGDFIQKKVSNITTIDELEKRLAYLKKEQNAILEEITILEKDVPMNVIENEKQWQHYFDNQKNILVIKLNELKELCKMN